MREVALPDWPDALERASFAACLASVLELSIEELPEELRGGAAYGGVRRWLGGHGLGLIEVADAARFEWAGPWLAQVRASDPERRGSVVMYGIPPGVAWDPAGITAAGEWTVESGFALAALDVAQARPASSPTPASPGVLSAIVIAPSAGAPVETPASATALAGRGLEGDRHAEGTGTFESGVPGSALTLIEAEVCESFEPPLGPDEHRRNLITRGIDLNGLVGREFTVGEVRCRGMRLCEPCRVVDGYAHRPVLRALVHRGGLRADILADGVLRVGDPVTATQPKGAS